MKIDGININYNLIYNEKNKNTLVLLHGWGQNTIMMQPIEDYFKEEVNVLNIDLPGFGKSDEPEEVMTIEDYTNLVNQIIEKLNLKNIIMLGHSFGGRIGICYASKYKVEKLILCSSPFIKRLNNKSLKLKVLKFLKKIPVLNKLEDYAKSKVGSTDYKNASIMMRKVLVETVNTDLTENVKKITVPTILLFGQIDEVVPLEEGEKLQSLLVDGHLIVYPNCGHFAYFDDINRTNKILDSFIKGEE